MQRVFGLEVPETVAEMSRPDRTAVLVYVPAVTFSPAATSDADNTASR